MTAPFIPPGSMAPLTALETAAPQPLLLPQHLQGPTGTVRRQNLPPPPQVPLRPSPARRQRLLPLFPHPYQLCTAARALTTTACSACRVTLATFPRTTTAQLLGRTIAPSVLQGSLTPLLGHLRVRLATLGSCRCLQERSAKTVRLANTATTTKSAAAVIWGSTRLNRKRVAASTVPVGPTPTMQRRPRRAPHVTAESIPRLAGLWNAPCV